MSNEGAPKVESHEDNKLILERLALLGDRISGPLGLIDMIKSGKIDAQQITEISEAIDDFSEKIHDSGVTFLQDDEDLPDDGQIS